MGWSVADVVVVGAGIVGASVAYHVASAGADVVLLDLSLPASGVTDCSFAWIGAPGGRDPVDGSTPIRRAALQGYRRLQRDLPDVQVRWDRVAGLGWGRSLQPWGAWVP